MRDICPSSVLADKNSFMKTQHVFEYQKQILRFLPSELLIGAFSRLAEIGRVPFPSYFGRP